MDYVVNLNNADMQYLPKHTTLLYVKLRRYTNSSVCDNCGRPV